MNLYRQLCCLAILLVLTACSQTKRDVEARAQHFVEFYYQQDKLAQALPYTTGAAKARLVSELKLDRQAGGVQVESKPEVVATLLRTSLTNADRAELIWKLQSAYGQQVSTVLTLSKVDGHWLVSEINESANRQ